MDFIIWSAVVLVLIIMIVLVSAVIIGVIGELTNMPDDDEYDYVKDWDK